MSKPTNEAPKVGDLFRLKSGGPTMTVYDVEPDSEILHCGWFWRGKFSKERFALGELKRVERTYLSGEDLTDYSPQTEQI